PKPGPKSPLGESLEIIPINTQSNDKYTQTSDLWARINAFLSFKAINTRSTYFGIIKEWCAFLGTEVGSSDAATKICSATDNQAATYRKWLENKPGETPRITRKQKIPESIELIQTTYKQSNTRDGTQSTLANATIAKKLIAIRRIYKMLISTGIYQGLNPFDSDLIPTPSAKSGQKRPTEMIDFSLVKKMIEIPDVKTPKGLRDKAILSILFGGGIRRNELINLRIADLKKTAQGTIFIRLRATKSKKDYDQALPAWASQTITELVTQRKKDGAGDSDYIFIGYTGRGGLKATANHISAPAIYILFKGYYALAGGSDSVSPHSARATAITKLLSDGIPHRLVQEFSRHSSIQMVELYDKRRIGVEENPGIDLDFEPKK
ncbi:MAG: tyrosine-type recombinase/integrase, partial [bacterium]|nr:tyrosine-type recombinase/integrase [bacterium]